MQRHGSLQNILHGAQTPECLRLTCGATRVSISQAFELPQAACYSGGRDRCRSDIDAPYHAMHHIYPDSYLSSYTTLFDSLMGTACQVRGRRVALTGASGSFGSAMRDLLEHAGATVIPLRFGVDWNYEDYSGTDAVLESADILVLAHGAKGEQAMQANCDSFLALIDRFKSLTLHRQVPVEVWAVGSEIECHPTFGNPGLRSYALWKRAFARAAARLTNDPDVLYRHVVPSAFRSQMGTGVMTGRSGGDDRLLAHPSRLSLRPGDLHGNRFPQLHPVRFSRAPRTCGRIAKSAILDALGRDRSTAEVATNVCRRSEWNRSTAPRQT